MSNEDAIFILSYIKNFRVQGKDAIDAIDIGINAIKHLPSVAQKSGKWIKKGNTLKCPFCGAKGEDIKDDYCFNYCPNCGAEMESDK